MPVDLSPYSLPELRELLPQVKAQIDVVMRQNHDNVVEELRQLAESRGFKLEHLTREMQASARKKHPAKFKDPESGKTWSGRGRKPKWVEEFLAHGGDLNSVKI